MRHSPRLKRTGEDDLMTDLSNKAYQQWLGDIKQTIQNAQQRAALTVNRQLLQLYWQIGVSILQQQAAQGWGAKVIEQVAKDLKRDFPHLKGFSRANLMYMRSFAEAWPDFEQDEIVQQAVGQLPWGHNLVLLSKLKETEQRIQYARHAQLHGWSRAVLVHHIELRTLERTGDLNHNFSNTLPKAQSDLARESFKDPYLFDFLNIGSEAQEREIENALIQHISQFLLELGAGFAYVGRQMHIEVGDQDFYIDLLFYHLKLRCYVVIELKAVDFKPEHAGQLSFYLTAVDKQVKSEQDNPTIGLLLCKTRNKVIAEYALSNITSPIGVSEYQLTQALPDHLKLSLPSIEEIEQELSGELGDDGEGML